VVLRRLAGRLFSRTFLLLLSFLLLFLLQFLLLLPVFLFELLELLLLFLLDLLPSAVFGILLLNLLLLLDLLLFDSLAFLILSLTELFQLLLMLLIELWVHRGVRAAAVRPRGWRAVVVRLVPSVVCRRITRLITRGRLYSVVGSWRLIRIILNVRLLLPRTIDAVVLYRAGPVGLNVLRHASIGGRCELDVRTSLLRVLGLRLTHLGNGRRQAAIGLNGLLLLYEGYGGGRRCRPGHDGAFLKPRWRSCRTRSASAEYASLLRRYRWSGRKDLRRGYFALIDLDHVSSDRLRRGEILLRCRGYPIRRRLVHILDVRNVFVNHHVVVVIVYDGVVHRRVGDVHVCHVSAADVIGRHEDLTRPKREPGHSDSTASSDSDAYAEVWSANPGVKR